MSEPQVLSMEQVDLYEELLKPSMERPEHLQAAGVLDSKVVIPNLIATVRANIKERDWAISEYKLLAEENERLQTAYNEAVAVIEKHKITIATLQHQLDEWHAEMF